MVNDSNIILETDRFGVAKSTFVDQELGIIAKKDIPAGQILFVVNGPILNAPTKYSFAIGINQHIEPMTGDSQADFGHYMNHSCDPTAFIQIIRKENQDPFIQVIARRNIKAGDELTFDYASLEYEVTCSGKICKCNTPLCRGKIHGFKDLPKDIIEKYKKEGIIPAHLCDI